MIRRTTNKSSTRFIFLPYNKTPVLSRRFYYVPGSYISRILSTDRSRIGSHLSWSCVTTETPATVFRLAPDRCLSRDRVATATRVLLPHDLTLTPHLAIRGGMFLLRSSTNVSVCRDTSSCEETFPRLCEETIAITVPSLFPVAFRDYQR